MGSTTSPSALGHALPLSEAGYQAWNTVCICHLHIPYLKLDEDLCDLNIYIGALLMFIMLVETLLRGLCQDCKY